MRFQDSGSEEEVKKGSLGQDTIRSYQAGCGGAGIAGWNCGGNPTRDPAFWRVGRRHPRGALGAGDGDSSHWPWVRECVGGKTMSRVRDR